MAAAGEPEFTVFIATNFLEDQISSRYRLRQNIGDAIRNLENGGMSQHRSEYIRERLNNLLNVDGGIDQDTNITFQETEYPFWGEIRKTQTWKNNQYNIGLYRQPDTTSIILRITRLHSTQADMAVYEKLVPNILQIFVDASLIAAGGKRKRKQTRRRRGRKSHTRRNGRRS